MARTIPRPRGRARARFRLAGLLLILASFEGGVLAVAAHADDGDEGNGRTITFMPGSSQSCAARPQPSSITVSAGTQVVFVNNTGSDATVRLDGNLQPSGLASGSNVAMSLDTGQHQVQLVLACGPSSTATVIVGPTRGSTRTTAAGAGGPPPVPPQTADPADSPGASSSTASPQMVSVQTSGAAALSPALGASPAGLDQPGNSTGVRLLAIVATICVLGVSAAVIRSIIRLNP
jgi:hypothetical protein